MNNAQDQTDVAVQVMDACVAHARSMLVSQMPAVQNRKFDFMPNFIEMTTQLYLAGVMWRFGEQFELPTAARDRGFICLMSMLVSDGMSAKKAQHQIAHLNQISRTADGQDTLAIAAGYSAEESDGSLATVFERFRNVPEVSGAPYRLLDRSKPVAAILAIAGTLLALLLDKSWGVALGVGVVLGGSTLAIALAMYRHSVQAKLQ